MDEFFAESCEPLYRFLRRKTQDRDLAADLAQEALLRAWAQRRSLQETQKRKVWLFRIARNLWLDHLRSRRVRERAAGEPDEHPDRRMAPEEQASLAEEQRRVRDAVNELPDRQREVIELLMIDNLTPRDIAEVLGIDAAAVRSSLSVARKQLRAKLPDLAGERLKVEG